MRKISLFIVACSLLIAGLFIVLTGCSSQEKLTTEDIRDFADPIAESMLQATNDGDFTRYSEFSDDSMKATTSEYAFRSSNTLRNANIGDYVSKKFLKTGKELDNIIVYYNATYTLTDESVEVKVMFKQVEDKWYVVGLWFDSPALTD